MIQLQGESEFIPPPPTQARRKVESASVEVCCPRKEYPDRVLALLGHQFNKPLKAASCFS
jgi:hypothetical protein